MQLPPLQCQRVKLFLLQSRRVSRRHPPKTSSQRAIRIHSPLAAIGDNGIRMATVALPVPKRDSMGLRLPPGAFSLSTNAMAMTMAPFANKRHA